MSLLIRPPLVSLDAKNLPTCRSDRGGLIGAIAGWTIAPLFALLSFVRQARTFHPRGPTYHASVVEHPSAPPTLQPLARRLTGHALVRFSGALWKGSQTLPDVLGSALRFRRNENETPDPDDDDQDLLLATIRRPYTMFLSPLTTRISDYFANDYFAVSPFDVGLPRPVYFRLRPDHASRETGTRNERLLRQVSRANAGLSLEVSDHPFGPWDPLLRVTLERLASIDGEALRFHPFRAGRGLRPRGFIHAVRLGVYTLSQRARPRHGAVAPCHQG
jgi:hypothetical protein